MKIIEHHDLSASQLSVIQSALSSAAKELGYVLYDFGQGITIAPSVGKVNGEFEGFMFFLTEPQ